MARNTDRLTDVQIKHWINRGQPLAKSDGEGLTFTISPNGTAAWVLRYRMHGRRKELSLGRYPGISLNEARKLRNAKLQEIAAGTDVAIQKQRAKHASIADWTVDQLAADFSEKVLSVSAPKTAEQRGLYLRKDVLPQLGRMLVRDVQPSDITALLDKAGKRGYAVANVVKVTTTTLFKHACGRRILDVNPCAGITLSAIIPKPQTRPRVSLTDAELRAFLGILHTAQENDALAFRILLATGVRVGELLSCEWADLDLDAGVWRIPRGKKKEGAKMRDESFAVPLAPPVVEWFRGLHKHALGSHWVLPARYAKREGEPMSYHTLRDSLRRLNEHLGDACRTWTAHDARSTMRSQLSALGASFEVGEKSLNHKMPGLVDVYQRNDLLDQRREVLSRWADALVAYESGDSVIPFKRKA